MTLKAKFKVKKGITYCHVIVIFHISADICHAPLRVPASSFICYSLNWLRPICTCEYPSLRLFLKHWFLISIMILEIALISVHHCIYAYSPGSTVVVYAIFSVCHSNGLRREKACHWDF